MMSRFIGGDGLFMFNGDWESGNLDKQMAGNVGFFLMPPAEAGGKHAAMSAPLTFGIGAKAKNADCAAFFLNWVAHQRRGPQDRRRGRRLQPRRPAGPADARRSTPGSVDRGDPGGRRNDRSQDNGAMDFIANATGAIFAEGWTPRAAEAGRRRSRRPTGCLKAVQAEYEKELSR